MSNENEINLKNSHEGTTTTFKETDSISSVPKFDFQIPKIEPISNPDELLAKKIQLKSEISALEELSKSLHHKIESIHYITKGELLKMKYELSLNITSNAVIQLSDLTEKFSDCLYQNNALSIEISQLQQSIVRERQYRNELIDQYNKMDESLIIEPMELEFTPLKVLTGPEIQSIRDQISFLNSKLSSFQKQLQNLQTNSKATSKLRTDAAFQILHTQEKKFQLSICSSQSLGNEVKSLQYEINSTNQQIASLTQENSSLLQTLKNIKDSTHQNEASLYFQAQNSITQIQKDIQSLFHEGNVMRADINDLKNKLSSILFEIEQMKLTLSSDNHDITKQKARVNNNYDSINNINDDSESDNSESDDNSNFQEELLNNQLISINKQVRILKNKYKAEKSQIIQNQELKKKEIKLLMKKLEYLEKAIKKYENHNQNSSDSSFNFHNDDETSNISNISIISNDSYPNIMALLQERDEFIASN